MVDFRFRMNGSHLFENQISCSEPSNFHGQKLTNINPEDLICEDPAIVRFQRITDKPLVQGEALHLVCEASGIPKPDITFTLPSGLNATVQSEGRVTVEENGATMVRRTTTADAGLYVCTATSPIGSTIATLVVDLETLPCLEGVSRAPGFSFPVLLGSIFGSIAGTLLVVAIVLAIWCRRNNNSPPESIDNAVILTNTNPTAVITSVQTDQMRPQGSLNPEHRPQSAAPLPHEYETVKPHPENPRPRSADPRLTSLNDAYRNTDERPPFPFPRSADGDYNAAQYQSLRKTDADHESADDYETPHDYVYVTE